MKPKVVSQTKSSDGLPSRSSAFQFLRRWRSSSARCSLRTNFCSVFREQTLDFDVPLRQVEEGVFIQDKVLKSASQERNGELFFDMPVPQICQRDGGDGERR